MRITTLVRTALIGAALVGSALAFAEEPADGAMEAMLYVGVGQAKTDDPLKSSATPYSIGFLKLNNPYRIVWGFDIAGEGTMLNSTGGKNNAIEQAVSYNLLAGMNLTKDENTRLDVALLVGVRETFASCPKSYVGYQCYADRKPETQSATNYGGVVAFTFKHFTIGARVTEESTQMIAGLRF